LKEAGWVESQRGKFGGYRLAMPMKQIPIGQVVRRIDGPLAPIGCVSHSAYAPCSCPDEDHCGLRMLMLDVRNAIAGILDRYTLADVVEVTTRKMKRDGIELPFSQPMRGAATRVADRRRPTVPRLSPTEGVVNQLLGDYSI
jgi:DNA-binding IscR family transcriptional regulator